jgi:hypothetical protein
MRIDKLIYFVHNGQPEDLQASFMRAQAVIDGMITAGSPKGSYVVLIIFNLRLRVEADSKWEDVRVVFTHRQGLLSRGDHMLYREYVNDGLFIGNKELKGIEWMEFI